MPIPNGCLPEICKQGGITKQDIGQIRVFDRDTRFEVVADKAEDFAAHVAGQSKKSGVRIEKLRGEAPPADAPSRTAARAKHAKPAWKPKYDARPAGGAAHRSDGDTATLDDWAARKKPAREGIPNWKPRYNSALPDGADRAAKPAGPRPKKKPGGKTGHKGASKAGPKAGKTKPNRAARRAKARE